MSHALRHTNIVQLYAMTFEQLHYGVVLEFVPFGPLNEFIHKYQVIIFINVRFSDCRSLMHGVAINRQGGQLPPLGICQIKNDQADQLCSLQKTKMRQTGI